MAVERGAGMYGQKITYNLIKHRLSFSGYIFTPEIDGTVQMKSSPTCNVEIRLAINEDLSIGISERFINPYWGVWRWEIKWDPFQGYILTPEIDGTVQMKSYPTCNAEIRLAINEDLSIGISGRFLSGISQCLHAPTP
ncbi:hypothetical protein HHK36_013765 [Tetracentron sinense]|uniref:Uncharacterized protein n=1 Tax=Tetracentron sinense TaxID=13715 RepID=A0A834Z6U2_TETSI|nr:hypothetical protein HHK36_013765 [Tetracentron sinense]